VNAGVFACSVDTTYWDFRTHLAEKAPEFLAQMEVLYNIQPLDDTEPYYSEKAQKRWEEAVHRVLWSSFEENLGDPDDTSMLGFSQDIVSQLDLEGGNVGIEDTMNVYWREQYGFIVDLQKYVENWASTISLKGVLPRKQTLVHNTEDFFMTFNYTNTLEVVYNNSTNHVFHIHGGLAPYCDEPPILGHGNIGKIKKFRKLAKESEEIFEEGDTSIHKAIADYYENTIKNTKHIIASHKEYFGRLRNVQRVIVFGLSLSNVDLPYIEEVRRSIRQDADWVLYYHNPESIALLENSLHEAKVEKSKYALKASSEFWD